ncbi:MAG: hypothetical protein HY403_06450 [Elusimicrobia bacterium]|nr:hypothetical protein [Elusimicrobiota bacterium]
MEKIDRLLAFLHRAVLAYLAVFTVPALLAFFCLDLTPGFARIMERLAPVWMGLMSLWFLSAAYFCCCLILSGGFREALLTRLSGFKERDEREEIVTAKAARSVFLVTLGFLIAAGLIGMVRLNVFSYTRWKGDRVPPLVKIGRHELRRGEVVRSGYALWPSIGIPGTKAPSPEFTEREVGGAQYYHAGGYVFGPEVSRLFFAVAALQVLLFHLFSRRMRV